MKKLFFVLSVILWSYSNAQDTLYFKQKSKEVVVIKEITQTDIQYKKFDNIDGPLYVVGKNDVEQIVFKNGQVEKINVQTPVITNTNQAVDFNVLSDASLNTTKNTINYEDTKRPRGLLILTQTHPTVAKRDQLYRDAKSLRNLQIHRDGTRTGGIIFGGLALGGLVIYNIINTANTVAGNASTAETDIFLVPPILFGVLASGFAVASISIHINLQKKRHQFVKAYND